MTKKDVQRIVSVLREVLPKLSREKQEYLVGLAEGMEMARGLTVKEPKEKAS